MFNTPPLLDVPPALVTWIGPLAPSPLQGPAGDGAADARHARGPPPPDAAGAGASHRRNSLQLVIQGPPCFRIRSPRGGGVCSRRGAGLQSRAEGFFFEAEYTPPTFRERGASKWLAANLEILRLVMTFDGNGGRLQAVT